MSAARVGRVLLVSARVSLARDQRTPSPWNARVSQVASQASGSEDSMARVLFKSESRRPIDDADHAQVGRSQRFRRMGIVSSPLINASARTAS